ncbi:MULTISPECIES: hypothetical protein [unclassified Nocardioides]|uniref:hypothetical protein n=1 Tax=unclassified Nocardioides TaxID=2615069 RepID=UPI000A4E4D37|nr:MULTISPECIES: hypothetical protein [unclassified Nocardioides]
MAKNSRWSRYRPPAEKRDETGQPIGASTPKPKPRSRPKKAATSKVMPPKPKAKSGVQLSGWVGLLIGVVSLAVVVGIIVAANSGDDDPSGEIDTSLLTEEFIGEGLAEALEVEGKDAVSVRLSEYDLTVEYFDPNKRESRYFETNDYVDGYEVRVEKSHYDDYQPRPFDLSTIDAATMIAAVKDALTKTDDIYTYSLRIDADRETGVVSMVVSVSGDESVEVTSAP